MKMICIDDETDILKFGDGTKELTCGRQYEILAFYLPKEDREQQVQVINDRGIKNDYLLSRFVTLEKFREERLNDLGI
jgi:hypothetical protein